MKNLFIGFLLATCMFLFMGSTDEFEQYKDQKVGTYIGFGDSGFVYRINTITGEVEVLSKNGWVKSL